MKFGCVVVGAAENEMNERLARTSYDDSIAFIAPGDINHRGRSAIKLRERALDGLAVDIGRFQSSVSIRKPAEHVSHQRILAARKLLLPSRCSLCELEPRVRHQEHAHLCWLIAGCFS